MRSARQPAAASRALMRNVSVRRHSRVRGGGRRIVFRPRPRAQSNRGMKQAPMLAQV